MASSTLKKNIARRHDLIPGAAHTYSKGDDQFPFNAPAVILKGKGAYVWGNDGKKYLDWCMGLRTGILGHAYEPVNKAAIKQLKDGLNFGRPHAIEFELADLITKTVPNAEMVKFGKNGSTVTTAATKLARAFTGRKYIALCSSQPFFSYDDWFIGTTPCNSGVPEEITKLSLTFQYNNIDSLKKLFAEHPGEIACVIMEAATTHAPENNFLKEVERITKADGAIFILDEMITGFRWGLKGAQGFFGLTPDLTTYGKAIGNGYSVAVLTGRRDIMELGGIKHKKERVFLISTTHGAETLSLAATMKTIQEMKSKKIAELLWKNGKKLRAGLNKVIKETGLEKYVEVLGYEPNLSMNFKDAAGAPSMLMRTIFLEEITKHNILFQGYFAISAAHKDKEIAATIKASKAALMVYKKALDSGTPEKFLQGEVVKPVFRKFN